MTLGIFFCTYLCIMLHAGVPTGSCPILTVANLSIDVEFEILINSDKDLSFL